MSHSIIYRSHHFAIIILLWGHLFCFHFHERTKHSFGEKIKGTCTLLNIMKNDDDTISKSSFYFTLFSLYASFFIGKGGGDPRKEYVLYSSENDGNKWMTHMF